MEQIEAALGYVFRDRSLLTTALTHPSYGSDHHVPHYQRLEFLGDAVLELSISRILFFEMPKVNEGRLTRLRAELVREETRYRIARKIDRGHVSGRGLRPGLRAGGQPLWRYAGSRRAHRQPGCENPPAGGAAKAGRDSFL